MGGRGRAAGDNRQFLAFLRACAPLANVHKQPPPAFGGVIVCFRGACVCFVLPLSLHTGTRLG